MFPHELLAAQLTERLGRRHLALGPLAEEMLVPLARGLMDQLSAYLDCRPTARFRLGDAYLREGEMRSYLFLPIRNGRGPLRLQQAMEYWHPTLISSRPEDFVLAHNARRWRFLDRERGLLAKLGATVADAVLDYQARRPGARLTPAPDAAPRIVEGVDQSYIVVELDDRRDFHRPGAPGGRDDDSRYRLQ